MAISPQSLNTLVRADYLKDIELKIDEKLKDPNFIKDMRYGSAVDPYYVVTVPGSLLEGEKAELALRYSHVGWTRVTVRNSDDTPGDRPGLVCIKMYKNEPNNFMIDK